MGLPPIFMNALKIFARPPNPVNIFLCFPPPECSCGGMPSLPKLHEGGPSEKGALKYKDSLN